MRSFAFVWAELSDSFRHLLNRCNEFVRFCRRYPGYLKPLRINAEIIQQGGDHLRAGHSLIITIQVMTFAKVSAEDHDAVGP